MPAPSQRRRLAVLFLGLAGLFAGIAVAALTARVWVVGLAAAALAAWMGSLGVGAARGR